MPTTSRKKFSRLPLTLVFSEETQDLENSATHQLTLLMLRSTNTCFTSSEILETTYFIQRLRNTRWNYLLLKWVLKEISKERID